MKNLFILLSFLFMCSYFSFAQKQKLPHLCNTDSLSKAYTYNQQKREIAYSLKNIGYIYNGDNNIKKSLQYYTASLKVCEEINDKEAVANLLFNIGKIYNNQGDRKRALEYRDKSKKISETIKKEEESASSLNKQAYSHNGKGNIKLALNNYYLSLRIFFDINEKQGIVNSLNNIGTIYLNHGDKNEGTGYYDLSLKIKDEVKKRSVAIKEEVNNEDGIANSMNNISAVYLKQQNYQPAKLYADTALMMAKELHYPKSICKAEGLLATIDSAMATSASISKEKKDALLISAKTHYKQYLMYKDSANKQEATKTVLDTQKVDTSFVNQAKQNTNEETIKTTDNGNKRIILFTLFGLLFIFAFLFLMKRKK